MRFVTWQGKKQKQKAGKETKGKTVEMNSTDMYTKTKSFITKGNFGEWVSKIDKTTEMSLVKSKN